MSTDRQNTSRQDINRQDTVTSEKESEKAAENTVENTAEPGASKSKRWSFIQSDLEKALDTWQELEKTQAKLSPEEEQFEKIKTIIGQLKSKIEQF